MMFSKIIFVDIVFYLAYSLYLVIQYKDLNFHERPNAKIRSKVRLVIYNSLWFCKIIILILMFKLGIL